MRKISLVKKAVIFLFLGFLVSWGLVNFPGNRVFASPPAPAPKCSVMGLIENVRFEKAYENPCVKTKSCPTDVQLSFPDTYYLSIKIQSFSLEEGDTRFRSCDSLYKIGSTQEIFIIKDKVRPVDSFSKGQTIAGTAVSFWGSSFETYIILTPPRVRPSPSIFVKVKLFFAGILNPVLNFINGVKTVETKTEFNY